MFQNTTVIDMRDKPIVLVIEDNVATALLFSEILADNNIEVATCFTGAEAKTWLSQNSPDLVLLDYSLPDMEATRLVEQVCMPPFIVITGHGDEHVAVEMMKKGATDYLVKTSSLIEELPILVNRYLSQIRTRQDLIIAKEQAKVATERFERAMNATMDGIWEWNLRTGEAYYSPAYNDILGYDQEESVLTVAEFESLIHPEDAYQVKKRMASLITGPDDLYEDEFRVRGKDGGWHWFLSRATCIERDETGSAVRIIGTHIDMTERRKLEKFLHLATKKVHLLNTSAGVDLINQVFMIKGYLDLLPEEITIPSSLEKVEKIRDLIEGIEHRVSFIRSYETLGIAEPKWVNTHLMAVLALSHHPYLQHESTVQHLDILVDPLVEQVFNSLVQTTFEHGGEKLSRVNLSYRTDEKFLTLIYEDDGLGIPVLQKEAIFVFGFNAISNTSLFLTREILDITGISISETGREGEGCVFELKIPSECYRFSTDGSG